MSKKKSVVSSQKSDEKAMTIITTILPPKKGVRRLVISAAPEGEMPVVLTGEFSVRHALMDRAYAAVLRRDPQVVTVKDMMTGNSKSITADADEEEPGNREPDKDEPFKGEGEELPAIEGDDVAAEISDISLPEIAATDEAADKRIDDAFDLSLEAAREMDASLPHKRDDDGDEVVDDGE